MKRGERLKGWPWGVGWGRALLCVSALGVGAACTPEAQHPVDARVVDAALPDAQVVDAAVVDAEVDAAAPDAEVDAGPIVLPAVTIQKAKPAAPKKAKPAARTPKKAEKQTSLQSSAMDTIRRHMGDVEHCYGRVALKDTSIAGRIVMRWTLDRTGKPTAVAVVSDTLKDKSVAACIKERAIHWQFPPPSGGIGVVTYPFNLRVD